MHSALFTDLYELTMAQAYHAEGLEDDAVFELFFREMPHERRYMLAAGLEQVLDFLEGLEVTGGDIDYLRGQGQFRDDFLERLRGLRFTGEVYAMREGTPVFPDEPIVQVSAPIFEAQILETFILNQVNFQTIAATKAARVVRAARGRTVVDFGSRRAHGRDAAMLVARTCYLAGAAGTSNVLAGRRYGVPIFGTMAHSYVQAHDDEAEAFRAFTRLYPGTTLLVDTYDTLDGVRTVIDLAREMGDDFTVRAIRLDSGDLADLAKKARALLDEAGLDNVKIFASSGLNERIIGDLLDAGAPIDGFGVGTHLAVSPDAPEIDMAYKLVKYGGRGRTKLSSSKEIFPDRKQAWRRSDDDDAMIGDVLGLHDDTGTPGAPLLEQVMRSGERTDAGRVTLDEAREYAAAQLDRLPPHLHSLEPLGRGGSPYPVAVSDNVREALAAATRRHERAKTSP